MSNYDVVEATDAEALAQRLADDVARQLGDAIDTRGSASLVVSGGSTPVPFFTALAAKPLAWERVTITLADERQVPEDHADSNANLVSQHLLTGVASTARFVSLYVDEPDEVLRVKACESRLADISAPFDVVILGMGGDSHTASLFPGMENLAEGLDPSSDRRCIVTVPPEAPHTRLSMTLAALLDSRQIILHFTGTSKRSVLESALAQGNSMATPVVSVFQQDTVPVTLYFAQ